MMISPRFQRGQETFPMALEVSSRFGVVVRRTSRAIVVEGNRRAIFVCGKSRLAESDPPTPGGRGRGRYPDRAQRSRGRKRRPGRPLRGSRGGGMAAQTLRVRKRGVTRRRSGERSGEKRPGVPGLRWFRCWNPGAANSLGQDRPDRTVFRLASPEAPPGGHPPHDQES